jgi:uncharacterized iron-regulated membrane protein
MTRFVDTVHLWIGLALSIPLVALGLSGSWLTYEEDVRAWFEAPPALALGAPRSATEILAAARAAAPAGYAASFYAPPGEDGLASVRFSRPTTGSGPRFVSMKVDPVSLAASEEAPRSTWLRNLHTSVWLQDVAGRSVAGWLGVAMLALGVTGVIRWWPKKPIRFALCLASYRQNYDMHGAVGIWGLVVFLLVSFSGVYLCFSQTLKSAVETVTPVRDMRSIVAGVKVSPVSGTEPMALEDAIALAQAADPAARVGFVSLPQRPNQPFRMTLLSPGQELGTPLLTVFVDPWTRRVVERFDPRDMTIVDAALAWQHGLHEGRGLGPVWKALVFLSGFLPLLFTITGVRMWWLKRRMRVRRLAPQSYATESERNRATG